MSMPLIRRLQRLLQQRRLHGPNPRLVQTAKIFGFRPSSCQCRMKTSIPGDPSDEVVVKPHEVLAALDGRGLRQAIPPAPGRAVSDTQTREILRPTKSSRAVASIARDGILDSSLAQRVIESKATKPKKLMKKSATLKSAGSPQPDHDVQMDGPRLPRSLAAFYLQPLRRQPTHGVPTCDLQLRSYTPRNLEFFADFALRAAYYLNLPAFGPIPLPKRIERWTVPKCTFIFKKSQENFERITHRRLIQLKDGHPDSVQVWLAFLQKHAYYGVGMKANVWEFSKLDVGKQMDQGAHDIQEQLKEKWEHFADVPEGTRTLDELKELLTQERIKATGGR